MNFIEMLSARPAPVKGGRIVRGYAMSGCKDADTLTTTAAPAPTRQSRAERDKERREARLALVLVEVPYDRAALTQEITDAAGCSKSTVQEALKELHKRKMVTRSSRRLRHGTVQYYWKRV